MTGRFHSIPPLTWTCSTASGSEPATTRVLREFYDSVKKSNTLTMNLRQGPGGVISMPEGNKGMEWFELGEWAGMCTHLGGMHLAQLRIMERMARHMGDEAYAKQCQAWLENGSRAMEEEMWAGSYYLNFYEKETGKKSDDVMSCQLDGEWTAKFHGLPGVFQIRPRENHARNHQALQHSPDSGSGRRNFCAA